MSKVFNPQSVTLTEHGKFLAYASANFRESEQIYMLEPENESGNVRIGADKTGSVYMYIPAHDVIVQ